MMRTLIGAVALALALASLAVADETPLLREPLTGTAREAGLQYLYHEGDFASTVDLEGHEPTAVGVIPSFIFPQGIVRDRFGLELFGAIEVPLDGVYTFFTTSDDGSRLYIGDRLVVNNDYLHGAREKHGSIGLRAGRHPIYVAYFEGLVDEVLQVAWEGPGIEKSPVPAAALSRWPKVVSFPRDAVTRVVLQWPQLQQCLALTVDTRDAPALAALREQIPRVLQAHYPLLLSLLSVEGQALPGDICISVRQDIGPPAYSIGNQVVLDAGWFTAHPNDLGCVVHELAHIVQVYHAEGLPGWLTEGIADYARHRAGVEDGWRIPEAFRPGTHYTDGYGTTAAFLVFLEQRYDPDLVTKLNRALKDGSYTEALFEQYTGKALDELWGEYTRASIPSGL